MPFLLVSVAAECPAALLDGAAGGAFWVGAVACADALPPPPGFELFCGVDRREGEGPTLYPVACAPQSWAAAASFLLIQSCLGLTVQGLHNRVVFNRPALPEGIPQLSIRGLRVGDASVDLLFERQIDTVRVQVLEKQGDIEVVATL